MPLRHGWHSQSRKRQRGPHRRHYSYIQSLEDRVAYLESQLAERGNPGFQSTSDEFAQMAPSWRSSSRDPIEQVVSKSLDAHTFYNTTTTSHGQFLLRSLLAEPIRSVSQTSKQNDHQALLDELPSETQARLPGRDGATRLIEPTSSIANSFLPSYHRRMTFPHQPRRFIMRPWKTTTCFWVALQCRRVCSARTSSLPQQSCCSTGRILHFPYPGQIATLLRQSG